MGRITYVAWLYVMSAACVVIAIGDRAWGWLIGGVVFFFVAQFARRQLKVEIEKGHEPPRFNFVVIAMLVMVVIMLLLFWIQARA